MSGVAARTGPGVRSGMNNEIKKLALETDIVCGAGPDTRGVDAARARAGEA